MKVLLLNPPGGFVRAGSRWPHSRKGKGYLPFPFYLSQATAELRQRGHKVSLKDCVALEWDEETLRTHVREFKPDLIAAETSAPSFSFDCRILTALGIPLVAVGFHATGTVREHLEGGFDYVVVGEYDLALADLADALQEGKEIPGFVGHRNNPEPGYAPLPKELDRIPWPAWDLLDMTRYVEPITNGFSVTVMSTRGCSMDCVFCYLRPFQNGVRYRMRDPKRVLDEVEELIRRYKPDEIYFDDDAINISKKNFMALCREVIDRKLPVPWSCMGIAKGDEETIRLMAESGCRAIRFGVESGNDHIIQSIGKHLITLNDIREFVRLCKKYGIVTHATYTIGLPGETREDVLRTIRFAMELGTDMLQFSTAIPYPGTLLYRQAREQGWLKTEDWDQFDGRGKSVLDYPQLPAEEIEKLYRLAFDTWHREMIRRRWATVGHHFYNAWKNSGILGVLELGKYSLTRLRELVRSESIR